MLVLECKKSVPSILFAHFFLLLFFFSFSKNNKRYLCDLVDPYLIFFFSPFFIFKVFSHDLTITMLTTCIRKLHQYKLMLKGKPNQLYSQLRNNHVYIYVCIHTEKLFHFIYIILTGPHTIIRS